MVKPNRRNQVVGIVVAVVVATAVSVGLRKVLDSQFDAKDVRTALARAAQALNDRCPVEVDYVTRLDSVEAGPGPRLTYLCTIMDGRIPTDDVAEYIDVCRTEFVAALWQQENFDRFRKLGVRMVRVYRSEDGAELGRIEVGPPDYR